MVSFSKSATVVLVMGEELENLALASPTCSLFSGGPDLSAAPKLINHYPASVAPAGHIRLRINASVGGDLVNPTAAIIGHLGLAGKSEVLFCPLTEGDKANKSDSQS